MMRTFVPEAGVVPDAPALRGLASSAASGARRAGAQGA